MIPLLFLLLSNGALAGEEAAQVEREPSALTKKAGLSGDDRKAIAEKIQDYVQAFVKGDEGMLRGAVTENYIEDQGGWDHFKELLAQFKEKWAGGAKAVSIEVRSGEPDEALAHYEIQGPKGRLVGLGSSMLVLRKEGGVWKFDSLIADAYPGSK